MARHALLPTAEEARRARRNHDKRVAAAQARLEAINAKVEKNRDRGRHKTLQRSALRFLPPGAALPEPRVQDLVRWPYTHTGRLAAVVPPELHDAILAEDVLCAWCREEPSTTVDHVRPVSRGGTNNPLNLVGACNPCNSAKADFLPVELGWVLRLPLRAFELARGA